MRYRRDGEGLHRAINPADGRYTYAMTFLDTAPASSDCFDQPDLKTRGRSGCARRRLGASWQHPRRRARPALEELAPTLPLLDVPRTPSSPGPPTCCATSTTASRSAQRPRLDRETTSTTTPRSCSALHPAVASTRCHRLFGMRYPFGDYHQAFVPEFNAGAMESAGCVTFRDPLVFQSRVVRTPPRRPATHLDPRDRAHVVRRHRDPRVVGRPIARTSPSPSTSAHASPPTSRSSPRAG